MAFFRRTTEFLQLAADGNDFFHLLNNMKVFFSTNSADYCGRFFLKKYRFTHQLLKENVHTLKPC